MTCESCVHWRPLANPDPATEPWGECGLVAADTDEDRRTGTLTRSTYTCDGYEPRSGDMEEA